MPVVQLFDLLQVVQVGTEPGALFLNYPVNRTDIVITKNIRNDVQVLLRDIDRKPVVTAQPLLMRISDRYSGKVVLTLPMTLIEPLKGRYQGSIRATDVQDWELGSYTYCVTRIASDGSEALIFTDRDRAESGVLTLRQGPIPQETTAITVEADAFIHSGEVLYTGALAGAASIGNTTGIQTAAVYGETFNGIVTAQGSLDLSIPSSDTQWFDIVSQEIHDLTGAAAMNIFGNYTWVRFKIENDIYADPGSITKIIFRNN